MLPNEITQSGLLDILFENRNKSYGAYPLRKLYNKRLPLALTVTLFVAAVFSVLHLLHRDAARTYIKTVSIIDDPLLVNIPPVQSQPLVSPPQPPVRLRQAINSTPVIASDDHPAIQ